MRETDADREQAYKIFQSDASLIFDRPSQIILRTWRHVLAHSSERANSDSEGDASKVEIHKRKHSILTHFRKYRKRSIPRTEETGDLKTAERKSESRNNRQFAAVVQDLTIQWVLPVCDQNFTGDGEEFTKVSRAVTGAKSYLYERSI